MILSFAFAGLFLVGNNVFGSIGDFDDLPPAITCHEHAELGRANVCWRLHGDWGSRPKNDWCWFTGWMQDMCSI